LAKIVSVHSFRGGAGKSNLTANLAVSVARAGKRVGVVDTDIQSPGIHVLFGLEGKPPYVLNDYLWGRCRIEQAAVDVTPVARDGPPSETPVGNLYLIPSSLNAGEIARVLSEGYDVALLNDGFRALVHVLKLDYLFIDTHPGVNEETLLSIALSDLLLFILRPDSQDFLGTAVTVELARRLEVTQMMAIVNKVPPGLDHAALNQHVEQMYGVPVVGIFPLNMEMARLASSGIFFLKHPDHPFAHELRRVTQQILAPVLQVTKRHC
jgi:MinD-like ATPase involved in chromosome partitioning or flagellar assembly